jgi:AcrR family transcriptional regulator
MAQPMTPATPSSPAQRERYERVLTTASAVLSAGGEEALQMKDLARRAGVSLATLYRYFPSRDHVLLAISLSRYQAAARKVLSEVPRGDSVRERVASHLLREFRAQQRDPRLTTALTRVLAEASRGYSQVIEAMAQVHQQVLQHVAASGPGPFTERQRRLLPIIVDNFGSASRRWQAGVYSAAEARFQIRVGCRLLDLPDAELELDAPAPHPSPA